MVLLGGKWGESVVFMKEISIDWCIMTWLGPAGMVRGYITWVMRVVSRESRFYLSGPDRGSHSLHLGNTIQMNERGLKKRVVNEQD